ncbi:MAG: hypothetical protein B6D70_03135, partial [gamma proteobacterium symbiont of Stewartia floridana]
TLLGIIPAHFLFFQAGWGGEFTATSMIGWIALAGIIVRNSILLVDFSIHQVQQGVSVVDSVIMACKTRTRPIMITAFALVCGSSVIFFDPIFQGMAISLASGVMVSTILTLIVIPLGCIKASKDILEVAAATAPAGSEHLIPKLEEPAAKPVEAAAETAAEQVQSEQKSSIGMLIWTKVIALFSLVFYLFKGIFLLIGQLFKGRTRKPKQAAPPVEKKVDSSSSGGGSSSSGSPPPTAGGSTPEESEPPVAAAPAKQQSAQVAAKAERAGVEAKKQHQVKSEPQPVEPVVAESESTNKVATEASEAPETAEIESKEVAQTEKSPVKTKQQTPAKPKKRPSTLKKQVAKKKAGSAAKKGNGESKVKQSAEPKKKAASNVASFPVRKKSARRGIRLK